MADTDNIQVPDPILKNYVNNDIITEMKELGVALSGPKGDKGDKGDQGLSAYQVAVNAGFSGSVNQWLASLVGAKGDKGDKGDDAVINVISQADYDALSDKTGVYFIEG